jgi:phosphoadenosine phosphosulfate reductase
VNRATLRTAPAVCSSGPGKGPRRPGHRRAGGGLFSCPPHVCGARTPLACPALGTVVYCPRDMGDHWLLQGDCLAELAAVPSESVDVVCTDPPYGLSNSDADICRLMRESLAIMREHAPPGGYYGCFSGGKDSVVLKHLAGLSGVQVAWHYNNTTMDPPELIQFIRKHHADVNWIAPRHGNMCKRAAEKASLPTRRFRWCCSEYKERHGPRGAVLLMGIRAEESARRKHAWGTYTWHRRTRRWVVNPILQWPSDLLWRFIRTEHIPYCSLYDEGWTRLGCIGCPLSGPAQMKKELARWPKHKEAWRRAAKRLWERRAGTLDSKGREWCISAEFESWQAYWDWWANGASGKRY